MDIGNKLRLAIVSAIFAALLVACGGGGGGGGGGAPVTHVLTAGTAGSGTGAVSSGPAGINCGATCTASFDVGTSVTLTAAAASGSVFSAWSGACTGSAAQVAVTVDAAKTCTASFAALRSLGVSLTGAGSGTVTGNPAGIACGATCSASHVDGTSVTLTAAPAAGSAFVQWGGDCAGTAATAAVALTAPRACTAQFEPVVGAVNHLLAVSKGGTGSGAVSSAPAGIDCGTACSAAFAQGTVVTLTATAAASSTFVGWSGACSGGATTVSVTMGGARACSANYDASSSQGLSDTGYHVVALAGRGAATPSMIRFANGVTEQTSPDALYAVNVLTGTGYQIGAAGEWRQLELLFGNLAFRSRLSYRANQLESAYDPTSGLIRDLRIRVSTFARSGRLYKVDHLSTAGPPVPQLWSTVTTDEICRSPIPVWLVSSSDIDDIADHWVFVSPGPDGRCSTADDVHRAIPFAAGPTDSAVTLGGAPIAALHDGARRRTGYILRNGSSAVRVNVDFGAPAAFLTLPALTSVGVSLGLLGRQEPRYWLFSAGGLPTQIFAYDLVNGGRPIQVASLEAGETIFGAMDATTEDGTVFLRLTNHGSRTIRVLRIDDNLSTQALATISPGSLIQPSESGLRTTSNRVVLSVSGELYSIPKSGGAPLLISPAASPYLGFGFTTAGENVWYPSAQNVVSSSKLGVVREDGTHPATIDLALFAGSGPDFLRPLLPAACSRECRHAALTMNVGPLSAIATNSGSEIVTYDGTTRAVIATHGRFPTTPESAIGTLVNTPQQLGQRGLANFYSSAAFELLLFKTNLTGLAQVPLN